VRVHGLRLLHAVTHMKRNQLDTLGAIRTHSTNDIVSGPSTALTAVVLMHDRVTEHS
jgi:hypothetical protein